MDIVATLRQLIGDSGVLDATELSTRSAGALRQDALQGAALARPRTTDEVASVLRWCHQHRIGVVPCGGLTGLVHGADGSAEVVMLSLERMNAIESIDSRQRCATVQAGVILQVLQETLEQHQLIFPLDLGARGSATLGGNAATNAGGNRVIRYGMMRNMVLGLEAVLADGTIVSSMNKLIKNNAAYDLKQLFIGSEGTLGVITRLNLRLWEAPTTRNMALLGLPDFASVTALLKRMDRDLGGTLSAFEVMWQDFYQLVTTAPAEGRPPIAQDYPFYVLLEGQGADPDGDSGRFAAALETVMAEGLVVDGALSQSEADCDRFWSLRDDVAQVFRGGYPFIFDISLPLAEMENYIAGLRDSLEEKVPDHHLLVFGHLGDGNLHLAVQVPEAEGEQWRQTVESLVYEPLAAFRGSVSAEHGIGLEKRPWLGVSRNAEELALMRTLKSALDPVGILNPGKVLAP
ncbi:FAD-binding oxidoreductase [Parahaliea aestuarii]|uniref:FAD-binding oxidoreductase n=1 Tax=Parahaliea aestuarii TaxID=1852021 RepID=A0A5C8ZZS9_9GAMM|nr:FAD-binding oxidoreductase [Parahaliea aestuarii]TXS93132.1 FAD-binding oxidoreductase [Parahaliea aestuarii]